MRFKRSEAIKSSYVISQLLQSALNSAGCHVQGGCNSFGDFSFGHLGRLFYARGAVDA